MLVEAGQAQVKVERAEFLQFGSQQLLVPIRLFMAAVVHEPVRFDLGRRQVVGDVNRHLLQPQLLSRQKPRVAADDDAVFVNDDGLPPAKLLDARGDLVDRALRNLAAVAGVGDRLINRPPAYL